MLFYIYFFVVVFKQFMYFEYLRIFAKNVSDYNKFSISCKYSNQAINKLRKNSVTWLFNTYRHIDTIYIDTHA